MNRKYYKGISVVVLLLALNFQHIHAQEQPGRRARAEQEFLQMEYAKAALSYEKIVADDKKVATMDMERLAESYYYINQYELAENWYAKIVEREDASQKTYLNYAEVLKKQGKYAEAKKQFEAYKQKYGANELLDLAIVGTDSAAYWMQNPTEHKIVNEQAVNTALAEFGLQPTANGAIYAGEPNSLLMEKSGMTGQAYLKVYSAERREDASLHYPNEMAEVFNHSVYHVGPVATDKENKTLYVTRTFAGNNTQKYKANGQRWKKQNLELKIYKRINDVWQEEDFPYNNVKQYSVGHASLNDTEDILYFASDMPGGHGGVDIWYSELQGDGSWGTPKNAGSQVNTKSDELFPSVDKDTLYFASDGHIGMGGLDIFKATGSKSLFTKPINMGYPINSPADDFSFVVSMDDYQYTMGYLSSNRTGGVGSDDIYSFSFIKPKITLSLAVTVRDKKTGALLDTAEVIISDKERNLANAMTKDGGKAEFDIQRGLEYRVQAEKVGYMADSTVVAAVYPQKDTLVHAELFLQAINKVGEKFVLENIYYDFDKYNIRPDAALILDKLVTAMQKNPTLKIELSSHTDSRGSDSYNMKLSQKRAQSAVDYIVSKGIQKDRLVAKGYGETRLVNRCANGVKCTPEEHQANRRTEVEVLAY